MPDITLCTGDAVRGGVRETCPERITCHRFLLRNLDDTDWHRQSMMRMPDEEPCPLYWPEDKP